MAFIQIIVLLILLYFSKFYVSLFRNYLTARKTGLHLIIVPVHPNHLVWMIISGLLRPVIKRYVPWSIYYHIFPSIYGWEYHEKRTIFRTLNTDSFLLVTCGRNEFYTIDPEAVVEICKRISEFDKPPDMKTAADIFGPSLVTSVGDAWSRQRKLVTGIINERISRVIFDETWRQTRAMVADIADQPTESSQCKQNTGVQDTLRTPTEEGSVYGPTFSSMKQIASNVLSLSAYGISQTFKTSTDSHDGDAEGSLDMIECIIVVISNIIIAAFVPDKFLLAYPSFFPGAKFVQRLCLAKRQFPEHVKKRIDDEREILKEAKPGNAKTNLTSMLISSSGKGIDEASSTFKDFNEMKAKHQLSLSEEEIRGNLFIFTTAGFETTSNALTYALVLLMADPNWQDWVVEEIDELFRKEEDNHVPDYASFYPKAFRCLALMMEVLRLYPPVVHLARCTPPNSWTAIKMGQQSYSLPPDSHVYVPFLPLHTNPGIWRNLNSAVTSDDSDHAISSKVNETIEDAFAMTQDEYTFRPSRWINQTLKQLPDGTMTHTLFQPPRGTYLPFSGGPRICPGQKMAQIEFVCVLIALFKDYRIEAVRRSGESDAEVHERMKGVLRDSHAEMTMVMDRLNEVEVRFVKRRKSAPV